MHLIRLLFVFLLCFSAGAAEKDSLRAAAESGSADAQFRLANEYFTGTPGRKRNFTLAAYWFRRVADRGYPEAMFNYALCLDQGRPIRELDGRDVRKALAKGGSAL